MDRGTAMAAYVIFDVDISDPGRYQEFMTGVKPALELAGAKYLARGGAHKVYEGDWEPRRIVILNSRQLRLGACNLIGEGGPEIFTPSAREYRPHHPHQSGLPRM